MRGVADPQLGGHLQWHSRARSAPEWSPHVGILMKELNAKGNRRSQFLLQRALVNQIVQHIPQVHLDMQDSWSCGDCILGQTRLWRCSRSHTLCHAWQQGGVPKPGFPTWSREVCGWQDGVIQSWARPGRVHIQCSDTSTKDCSLQKRLNVETKRAHVCANLHSATQIYTDDVVSIMFIFSTHAMP